MRKIFLAAFVAAIVAVSGCTSQQVQDQAPQEPTGEESEVPPESTNETSETTGLNESVQKVYYTGSGFQPSEVAVQRGEKVVWVNNASLPMWVASDRHPTHTQYAGSSLSEHCGSGDQSTAFDQCGTGERFSFTFEKAGEWSYHNHKLASDGGTVTVTG